MPIKETQYKSKFLQTIAKDPILFNFHNIIVVKFGLITGLVGVLFCLTLYYYVMFNQPEILSFISNLLLTLPIFVITGAYFMDWILRFKEIITNPSSIRKISFYFFGGLLAGILYVAIMCIIYSHNIIYILDLFTPFILFFHGLSRLACINYGCCVGRPKFTKGLIIIYENKNSKCCFEHDLVNKPLYPTQLYELVLCMLLGVISFVLYQKFNIVGFSVMFYLITYGIVRYAIEEYKYIKNVSSKKTIWQNASLVMIGLGLITAITIFNNNEPRVESIVEVTSNTKDLKHLLLLYFILPFIGYGIHLNKVGQWSKSIVK